MTGKFNCFSSNCNSNMVNQSRWDVTCTCWRSERSSWWPSRNTMKLRSTFSRVTNETRACAAGAPVGTPNPLRPGRSWKNARALRNRLILGMVVRRQCTSLSGSELAIFLLVCDSESISCTQSHLWNNYHNQSHQWITLSRPPSKSKTFPFQRHIQSTEYAEVWLTLKNRCVLTGFHSDG